MSLGTVHSAEDEEGAVENLPHIGGDGIGETDEQNVGLEREGNCVCETFGWPNDRKSILTHRFPSM